MFLSISWNFYAPVNFDKAIWLLWISAFLKKIQLSVTSVPEVLAFTGHSYEDSENIQTDCVVTVIFNLHQIKQKAFLGTPGMLMPKLLTSKVNIWVEVQARGYQLKSIMHVSLCYICTLRLFTGHHLVQTNQWHYMLCPNQTKLS